MFLRSKLVISLCFLISSILEILQSGFFLYRFTLFA